MKRILYVLHWINLDTAIGAVITALFIAKSLGTRFPMVASLTLCLAVLSIYNFDHLMDARRVKKVATSARHRFYQDYLRPLSVYQLVLMAGLMTIIWYLPAPIIRAGIVLALITGTYFILLFFVFPKRFLLKEVMIAMVYTTALFLAPIYSGDENIVDQHTLLLYIEIMVLAVSNTLILAWYDFDADINDRHTSLATNLGKVIVYRMALINLGLIIALTALQVITTARYFEQLILLVMAGILYLMLLMKDRLIINERYRIVGDAIFLVPGLALFI